MIEKLKLKLPKTTSLLPARYLYIDIMKMKVLNFNVL